MEITIASYEDWMKSQVSELFSMQYGFDKDEFARLLDNFYDHPYQKNKCIRVVALDGKKVAGFQSFFHWPYVHNGKTYNSYQSGNSLVHPEYRGKRIFQKLLGFVDEKKAELSIDFLMGFPVEESFNSFIRNGWNNLFNLTWYIKVINPLSWLFNFKSASIESKLNNSFNHYPNHPDAISLSSSADFTEWRKLYSGHQKYFHHFYRDHDGNVCFEMKFVKRKQFINELVIGNIQSDVSNNDLKKRAISDLVKRVRRAGCISILTIAVNEKSNTDIRKLISGKGFIKSKKSIYFIIKPLMHQDATLLQPELWSVYRSDIDTW